MATWQATVLLCEGLTLSVAQMRESLFVHEMARTMMCPWALADTKCLWAASIVCA